MPHPVNPGEGEQMRSSHQEKVEGRKAPCVVKSAEFGNLVYRFTEEERSGDVEECPSTTPREREKAKRFQQYMPDFHLFPQVWCM